MKSRFIIVVEIGSSYEYTQERIYDLICSMGHAAQLTEHSFLLVTEQNAVYIRDAIKNSPYDVDGIFVISADAPAAWRKVMADNDDIKTLLHEQ